MLAVTGKTDVISGGKHFVFQVVSAATTMIGANGTRVMNKTLMNNGNYRVEVENPKSWSACQAKYVIKMRPVNIYMIWELKHSEVCQLQRTDKY
jgi:hypothetical protein